MLANKLLPAAILRALEATLTQQNNDNIRFVVADNASNQAIEDLISDSRHGRNTERRELQLDVYENDEFIGDVSYVVHKNVRLGLTDDRLVVHSAIGDYIKFTVSLDRPGVAYELDNVYLSRHLINVRGVHKENVTAQAAG